MKENIIKTFKKSSACLRKSNQPWGKKHRYRYKSPNKHLLVLKTSWRHVLKTSSTHLPRNNFSLFVFEDVLKTSWKMSCKTSWKTKNCYAEDVFKTSSRHFLKTSWRYVLKTSWRHALKTSWRHVLKTFSRRLGDKKIGIAVSNESNVYIDLWNKDLLCGGYIDKFTLHFLWLLFC